MTKRNRKDHGSLSTEHNIQLAVLVPLPEKFLLSSKWMVNAVGFMNELNRLKLGWLRVWN